MKRFIRENSIFLHKTLNGAADSLIKIFIPIIILKVTGNLLFALAFMIVRPIFFVLFNILLKRFLKRYPVISIIIHIFPIIAIQIIVFFVSINIWIILLLALLMALFNVFYSVPTNSLFIFSDKKLNVSKMEVGTNVGRIVCMLVGGFIINDGSIYFLIGLLVVSSVMYISSVIPLIFGEKEIHNFSQKEIKDCENEKFDKKKFFLFNIINLGFGSFQIVIDEVLPVYLFVFGLSFYVVAILQAVIELGKLLSNFFAGMLYKKDWSKWSIIFATSLFIVCLGLIFFIKNIVAIYVLVTLIALTYPLVFVPIFKKFCENIKGKKYCFDEMSKRDTFVFLGRPFLISTYFIGFSFIAPFIVGGICALTLAVFSFKIFSKKNSN